MAPGLAAFNVADPVCTVNQCLQQVIGTLDNNPVAQYSACVSMFGSPSTSTVTLPADDVFSTTTATVPYTDIIVTITTTSSTQTETSTSYSEETETVTEYLSTSAVTVTEVVTAPTSTLQPAKQKRSSNKKRGCQRRSSTGSLSSSATSAPATSATPAITASATTTATASTSAAPNCANEEEYSSACSCINAVGNTAVFTSSVPAATELVTVTESSAILSTSTSVVTVVVSNTVVVPATTTVTSTTTEPYTTTTTTVTSTTVPVPPTQTAYLTVDGRQGKYVTVVGNYVQYDYSNSGISAAAQFNILTAGGQPSLTSNPSVKLRVHQSSTVVGVLYFETDAAAAAFNDPAVTCTLDSGVVSCAVPSLGFDTMLSCGAYIYLAKSTFKQSGCVVTKLRMSA